MKDPLTLLADLVALPGPPGQEDQVRDYLYGRVSELGLTPRVDPKGNLIVGAESPKVVVTAHMDEIALAVRAVDGDGMIRVKALGGLHPWKLGEGPVLVMTPEGGLNGVVSFGGVHTQLPNASRSEDDENREWDWAGVETGLDYGEVLAKGVRPGSRIVIHPSRRTLLPLGDLIAGYFLDDRADLVSWLLALDALKDNLETTAFVATVSEETGGEGALYFLSNTRPDVCIALELGPNVEDSWVEPTDVPTVWAYDSFSAMTPSDGELVAQVGADLGLDLQFQALSRGGSDASCAASHGHCARPITLGLPLENSHGFEIFHPGSMKNLARVTAELVRRLQ